MAVAGYKWHTLGGVRTSYLTPQVEIDATRDTPAGNIQEYAVNRVVAANWSCQISATLFGSSIAEALIGGYISAGTEDIPFVGGLGRTAGDDADIVLSTIMSPVGNAGVDSERLSRGPLSAAISSREPLHGSKVLHAATTSSGITGDTDGTGVQLGAIPAGSEGIFVFVNPHWPTLGGTAIGTYTLEHDVDNTWSTPTTAVETTGTNPWTPTAGTAGYQVVTIDGDTTAITDTWWRVTFTTITGTIYPIASGAIVTKTW